MENHSVLWLRVTWGCQTAQFLPEALWGQIVLVVLHWKLTQEWTQVNQTAGNSLRRCAPKWVPKRELCTKWMEISALPPVSWAGTGGLFASQSFPITSVLRWVSLWEKKIISLEWFSQENQLNAFGRCNGLSECAIENFLVYLSFP